jgi:hypothetical protein
MTGRRFHIRGGNFSAAVIYLKMMKKIGFFILLSVLAGGGAWSMPFLGVDTGLLVIINGEAAGAPSPYILQGLGVTLPLVEEEGFFLYTGVLFYGCQYQWNVNRAIPADNELADTIWTLLTQLDLRIGVPIRLADNLTFGMSAGPALVLPVPLFAFDNGEAYRGPMFEYFYLGLKFLYAEGELFLRWAIVDGIDLSFKLRGMYQLAAIWDVIGISRFNGLQIQALISIETRL